MSRRKKEEEVSLTRGLAEVRTRGSKIKKTKKRKEGTLGPTEH